MSKSKFLTARHCIYPPSFFNSGEPIARVCAVPSP